MAKDKETLRALEIGRQSADKVIRVRMKALRTRTRAVAMHVARSVPTQKRVMAAVSVPKVLRTAVGSAGIIVAEGDSWFDYPWTDVLGLLEDDYGYDVESVAHKGDRVEEMAYADGQLEEFSRRIEKLLRQNRIPKAILLSGGGNDVAGPEFGMLLNHAASAVAGLNKQIAQGVIDQRIRIAYITILSALTQICRRWTERPIPILIHGYDYPVPDGRGFLGGWWLLPGPWLEPGFREKGFEAISVRKAIVKELIDRLNTMLAQVTALPDFGHVSYVNLRSTLSSGGNYKEYWANELHPTKKGFRLVTAVFAKKLDSLPG
ncbi:MAG: SGNH/GDSL hydrolase family protein [Nitrospira sp.]|nr:SGNH/GDSL hydrolase family protein [Nitrospira sp.]